MAPKGGVAEAEVVQNRPFISTCRCGQSRDVFKFWEISDDILETVQDRDLVTMEDK